MKKIAIIISLSLLVLVTSCTKEESAALKLKGVWEATVSTVDITLEFSNIKKDGGDFSYKYTLGSLNYDVLGEFTVKKDAAILNLAPSDTSTTSIDLEILELDAKTLKLKGLTGGSTTTTFTKK